jgi:hypothetical protein
MDFSPSWETVSFAAAQELPKILWNPEVHCRSQKIRTVRILNQISPVHITTYYRSQIQHNINSPKSWSS